MRLEQIQMPVTNRLYTDYVTNSELIAPFFEYKLEAGAFTKRAQYLNSKTYKTEQLAEVIKHYMEPFGITPEVQGNIQQLSEGAFAVVGGQQAGILTGPLYSVHKAITVILLARQQREQLNKPVVPLFWIAGEDHDIEEINHTYTIQEDKLTKRAYSIRSNKKYMASKTEYNKQEMVKTMQRIFADYGETQFTAQLLKDVIWHVENNQTYTELFTSMMNKMFGKYGLLMIDAADERFRSLESEYFVRIVEQSEIIAKNVVEKEMQLSNAGYGTPISATISNVNLFYVKDGERYLLEWHEGVARNNAAQVKFSKEELIQLAEQSPESLSNNVVTRPLMQEMVIPVLAFVGGPGELAYWATLKPAFETLHLQMPIFTPRLHMTIVSRNVQALFEQLNINAEDAFSGRTQHLLDSFIESIQDKNAIEMIQNMEQMLNEQYEKLEKQLQQVDVKIEPILIKNKNYHHQQLEYLRNKIQQEVMLKHDVKIKQYTTIQLEVTPNNGLQERMYNPYMYFNEYGETLIDDMFTLDLELNGKHHVLYL